MIKTILRKFMSLVLVMVIMITFMPDTAPVAYGETNGSLIWKDDPTIELTYTKAESYNWEINGTNIVGTAKSSKGGCDGDPDTPNSTTLTIKSMRSAEAIVSFEYDAELQNGKIEVDDLPSEGGSNSYFSKLLSPEESITIKLTSGSSTNYTTIIIKKIKLISNTIPKVVFSPSQNGSYTVNDSEINNEQTFEQPSSEPYKLIAKPNNGFKFIGWYDSEGNFLSGSSSTSLNVEKESKITAKFIPQEAAIFETGGKPYEDLNEAVTNVVDGKIVLSDSGSINGNYTIPSGVTLLIPFDAAGTLYKETPAYTTTAEAQRSAFKTLTMKDGACINVEGAISVGGKHYTSSNSDVCKTTGMYGLIKMEEGSSITLKDGSNLYAWGYIVGDGNITANSGAKVYEYFQVTDWRGGTVTGNMKDNEQKVFPFSQYYVQNIESNLTINSGADEYAYISVTARIVGTKSATIPFIGADSLFSLKNNSTFTKKYIPSDDRVTFEISGDADLNSIAIAVAGVAVDSKDYVLPINNNVDINVKSGTTTITKDVALLPGTHTSIAGNAELKVASGASLYIYDDSEWSRTYVWGSNSNGFKPVAYSPSNKSERTIADARVDVCGKLTAEGSIYTTKTGADICSSTGKGEYSQLKNSGTGKVTYQYDQSNKKYIEIPITPANLHNADGTYTESPNVAETITYKDGRWQHRYGEWSVTKAATCSKVGSKERSCEVCGAKETSEIAIDANAHTWESNFTIDKAAVFGFRAGLGGRGCAFGNRGDSGD